MLPYIDWTPFFSTWELHGKYPAILEDDVVGEEASNLFADAKEMLEEIRQEAWLHTKEWSEYSPLQVVGDDIEIYADDNAIMCFIRNERLRQQTKKAQRLPTLHCQILSLRKNLESKDYIGGFVVTSGLGIDEKV